MRAERLRRDYFYHSEASLTIKSPLHYCSMASFNVDGLGGMSLTDLIRFLEQPRENVVLGDLRDSDSDAVGPKVYDGDAWMASITHASRCGKRSRKRVYTGNKWMETISRRRRRYLRSLEKTGSYDHAGF